MGVAGGNHVNNCNTRGVLKYYEVELILGNFDRVSGTWLFEPLKLTVITNLSIPFFLSILTVLTYIILAVKHDLCITYLRMHASH